MRRQGRITIVLCAVVILFATISEGKPLSNVAKKHTKVQPSSMSKEVMATGDQMEVDDNGDMDPMQNAAAKQAPPHLALKDDDSTSTTMESESSTSEPSTTKDADVSADAPPSSTPEPESMATGVQIEIDGEGEIDPMQNAAAKPKPPHVEMQDEEDNTSINLEETSSSGPSSDTVDNASTDAPPSSTPKPESMATGVQIEIDGEGEIDPMQNAAAKPKPPHVEMQGDEGNTSINLEETSSSGPSSDTVDNASTDAQANTTPNPESSQPQIEEENVNKTRNDIGVDMSNLSEEAIQKEIEKTFGANGTEEIKELREKFRLRVVAEDAALKQNATKIEEEFRGALDEINADDKPRSGPLKGSAASPVGAIGAKKSAIGAKKSGRRSGSKIVAKNQNVFVV